MKEYETNPASLPYIRPGRTLIILAVGIVLGTALCAVLLSVVVVAMVTP